MELTACSAMDQAFKITLDSKVHELPCSHESHYDVFADQMHHWGSYLGKYKERSSAQNRHRTVSTSDQLTMTSVMLWRETGGKPVTQMLQHLHNGGMQGERLCYLQVMLYWFKKSLEWKWTWTSCTEKLCVIHYCPSVWACTSQLQWKDNLKICFNLRPSFPVFQWRNTWKGACLSACRSYW